MSKLFYVATSFLLAALTVTMALGLRESNPAVATTLDGFDIQTNDKQVIVTLFTDERTEFKTESQGKQFAIVLNGAKLSEKQLNSGMPVVIDNRNKFIGRAVPTEDGRIKIILPNLPVNDYAVSVQQKPTGLKTTTVIASQPATDEPIALPAVAASTAPAQPAAVPRQVIQPRAAVIPTKKQADTQFEAIANQFGEFGVTATAAKAPAKPATRQVSGPRIASSQPAKQQASTNSSNLPNVMANPYVSQLLANPPKPNTVNTSLPQSVGPTATPAATGSGLYQPTSTVSVADSLANTSSVPVKDPLWHLHSLPPFDPAQGLATQDLQAAATADGSLKPGLQAQAKPADTAAKQPAASTTPPASEVSRILNGLPHWLLIMTALFLGGIGLFAAVGALLLVRMLLMQFSQKPAPTPVTVPFVFTGLSPALGHAPMGPMGISPVPMHLTAPADAMGEPASADKIQFADTAIVNGVEYLKHTPGSVAEAVHNTTLLKFPASRKTRTASRPKSSSRLTGNAPRYQF